jgi:hypothetical protein
MNERHFSRTTWGVLAFTAAYMAAALAALLRGGSGEFVLYLVVMLVLVVAVAWLHARVRLHPAALWGLSLWGLAHMAGGLVEVPASWPTAGASRVLYNLWLVPERLKYDHAVHAYGFGLTTCVCWQALRAVMAGYGVPALRPPALRPTWGLLALCAAAGMGFGAANEVVEFLATRLLPETNVGGYENTGWDLVANLTGCLLAAVLMRVMARGTE